MDAKIGRDRQTDKQTEMDAKIGIDRQTEMDAKIGRDKQTGRQKWMKK
jgi:hypothetical protein